MKEITVAVVQMWPKLGEMENNLGRMAKLIEEIAAAEPVDLIVFPELATTGYECGVRFTELADAVPGHAVNFLAKRAQEANCHVVFGLVERKRVESIIYDAAVMIGPDGEVVDKYHKVHLWGEEKLAFRAGYRYPLLETEFGRVGLLLGWDLAFPEVARTYALKGADLLCVLANWERDKAEEWHSYLQARAYENAMFIAAANRVGQELTYTFAGESCVLGPRGQVYVALDGEQESYGLARIDLDEVRKMREEFQLLQCRQPQTYREVVRMY